MNNIEYVQFLDGWSDKKDIRICHLGLWEIIMDIFHNMF